MTITTSITNSFKKELLGGIHDLDTDVLKIALYTEPAPVSAGTTVYTTQGEVVGAGYLAGGKEVSAVSIFLSANTAYIDMANAVWTNASFTVHGCMLYNSTKSNKSIATWKFALPASFSNADFEVVVPVPGEGTAVIRVV